MRHAPREVIDQVKGVVGVALIFTIMKFIIFYHYQIIICILGASSKLRVMIASVTYTVCSKVDTDIHWFTA